MEMHGYSQVSRFSRAATAVTMLRRVLWTGLYAGLAAAAALVARRTAAGVWRLTTGKAPPTEK